MTNGNSAAPLRLALLGAGIAHSLSPVLQAAALAATGYQGTYTLYDCASEAAARAVMARVGKDLDGLNVTTPWKGLAAALCQTAPTSPASINTLWWDAGLRGTSTDGAGLLAALAQAGLTLQGRTVAVLGLGGAGQALAAALADQGLARLILTSRDPQKLAATVAQVGAASPQLALDFVPWGAPVPDSSALAEADLVVHATRLGHGESFLASPEVRRAEHFTRAAGAWPGPAHDHSLKRAPAGVDLARELAWLPWAAWAGRGTVLFDSVYAEALTRVQGLAVEHGLGADMRLVPGMGDRDRPVQGVLVGSGQAMLAHQAAHSFACWTGHLPDGRKLLRTLWRQPRS